MTWSVKMVAIRNWMNRRLGGFSQIRSHFIIM